jgi:hypothetical protein
MQIRPVGADLYHLEGRTDGQMDIRTVEYDETNSFVLQFRECGGVGNLIVQ